MRKEYQAPEVEVIDLTAEEAVTAAIPLSEGINLEGDDFTGDTSVVDKPEGWL